MYTSVSTYPPTAAHIRHLTLTAPKELTMRINPSDILFIILSTGLLLLTAFTLGGLAAHPFAG